MPMKVLIVGSGGREHALAWKIAQSPDCDEVFVAPGNGGSSLCGENVAIDPMDFPGLARFAKQRKIGLTVVGPDAPLGTEPGIVNYFRRRHLRTFGPTYAAAQIEASKTYAKDLMRELDIPCAASATFTQRAAALRYVDRQALPMVIKADGYRQGKGVFICRTPEQAYNALRPLLGTRGKSSPARKVIVEQYLGRGIERSAHALCDGTNFRLFPLSMDHKYSGNGDTGTMTGGMGTIGPLPWDNGIPEVMVAEIVARVVQHGRTHRRPFAGCLYPGLMRTADGLKVLEFNARFGDPEAQVYMRLLKTDLLALLNACADGRLADIDLAWHPRYAACIVLASGGYPDKYDIGFPISGIQDAEQIPGVVVFHSATRLQDGTLYTNGGRVLSVTAVGATLKEAITTAYRAVARIKFKGMYFRTDIGAHALQYRL